MTEILGSLTSWRAGIAALVLAPLSVVLFWVQLKERHWRYTSRKSAALRKLLVNGKWRKASPLELQFAMQDAFGKSLEPIELAFAETRARPLDLLNDRILAGGNVRMTDDGSGYVDMRRDVAKHLSLSAWSFLWNTVGVLCGVASILVVIAVASGVPPSWLLVAVEVGFMSGMLIWISAQLSAADRVIQLKRHPPVRPIPPSLSTAAQKPRDEGEGPKEDGRSIKPSTFTRKAKPPAPSLEGQEKEDATLP